MNEAVPSKPGRRSSRKSVPDLEQSNRPESNAERLARRLRVTPVNIDLYRTALTHRSAAGDLWRSDDSPAAESNERLEFYGDAVLGAIVAEYLYRRFSDASEGDLTRQRSAIVRAEQLTKWGRELGLGKLLYLAQSERISSTGKDRLLAGAFEAVLGALAIDQGDQAARELIERMLRRDVDRILATVATANPKGKLQEITQDRYQTAPTYHTLVAAGPAHQRAFTVEVRFQGRPLATGNGASKRGAEEAAAAAAIARLEAEGDLLFERGPADSTR